MKLSEIQTGHFVIIYGPPGAGKTASLRSLVKAKPEGVVVTTEPGGLAVLRKWGIEEVEVITAENPQELADALKALEGKPWVALDSLTQAYDDLFDELVRETAIVEGRFDPSLVNWNQYRLANRWLSLLVENLVRLTRNGTHVVVIAHEARELVDSGGANRHFTKPDLPGKSPELLLRKAACCVRCGQFVTADGPTWLFHAPEHGLFKDWTGSLSLPCPNDALKLLEQLGVKWQEETVTKKAVASKPKPPARGGAKVSRRLTPKERKELIAWAQKENLTEKLRSVLELRGIKSTANLTVAQAEDIKQVLLKEREAEEEAPW